MIRKSFIFLDRIGLLKEQNIWKQGIKSWDDFITAKNITGISKKAKLQFDRKIKKTRHELYNDNINYFCRLLPFSETYRLYYFFWEECLFLDIETTGNHYDITVIGLSDGHDTKIMVKGINLDKNLFLDTISRYKMLVTFNGASFDIPAIKSFFNVSIDMPHIDLRHVCSRIGLTGGLKMIEKKMGIKRPKDVMGIRGGDAAYLWHAYKLTGDREYLEMLVRYNEEDILNLRPLADKAIPMLWDKIYPSEYYRKNIK